jgi:hypothetical protein
MKRETRAMPDGAWPPGTTQTPPVHASTCVAPIVPSGALLDNSQSSTSLGCKTHANDAVESAVLDARHRVFRGRGFFRNSAVREVSAWCLRPPAYRRKPPKYRRKPSACRVNRSGAADTKKGVALCNPLLDISYPLTACRSRGPPRPPPTPPQGCRRRCRRPSSR